VFCEVFILKTKRRSVEYACSWQNWTLQTKISSLFTKNKKKLNFSALSLWCYAG